MGLLKKSSCNWARNMSVREAAKKVELNGSLKFFDKI